MRASVGGLRAVGGEEHRAVVAGLGAQVGQASVDRARSLGRLLGLGGLLRLERRLLLLLCLLGSRRSHCVGRNYNTEL